MAKPKLYTARALVDAGRTAQKSMLALLKKNGIKPCQEIKTGKMTYRLYDQAAMDFVLADRAKKDEARAQADAPVAPSPDATPRAEAGPAMSDPGAVFALIRKVDDLMQAVRQVQVTQAEAADGLRYLNGKLDQMTVQMRAINTELGIGVSVLDGLAKAPADDEPARTS